MICPNCGKETPDGKAFCGKCGIKLSGAVGQKMQYGSQGGSGGPQNNYGAPSGGQNSFQSDNQDQALYGQNQAGQTGFGSFGNNNGATEQEDSFAGPAFSSSDSAGFGGDGGFGGQSFGGDGGFGGQSFGGDGGFGSQSFGGDGSFGGQSFGGDDGGSSGDGVGFDGPGFAHDAGNSPGPSSFGNPFPGPSGGRKGLPKPLLIVLIVLAVLMIVAGGMVMLDYFGIVDIPFIGASGKTVIEEPQDKKPEEKKSEEEKKEDKSSEEKKPEKKKTENIGQLSISVTDVEPADLSDEDFYEKVDITGVEAADGIDGTKKTNLVTEDDSLVWKIPADLALSEEGKKIRLTFEESDVQIIRVKAGNWSGPENYNNDGRPIKINLTVAGVKYPLSINDAQKAHYIVLSKPYETKELILEIDSISNSLTGNCAITQFTIYEAD